MTKLIKMPFSIWMEEDLICSVFSNSCCIKTSVLGNCKMLDLLIISIYNKALYSKSHGKKSEKSSFLFYRPSKPIQTTFNTREQTFYLTYCPVLLSCPIVLALCSALLFWPYVLSYCPDLMSCPIVLPYCPVLLSWQVVLDARQVERLISKMHFFSFCLIK